MVVISQVYISGGMYIQNGRQVPARLNVFGGSVKYIQQTAMQICVYQFDRFGIVVEYIYKSASMFMKIPFLEALK